jgi:hypothetical protein
MSNQTLTPPGSQSYEVSGWDHATLRVAGPNR